MGSCISKCKPRKTSNSKKLHSKQQDQCKCTNTTINTTPLVQDKLVISQAPISSPPKKTSITSPLSPSISSPSANSSVGTKTSYPTTSSISSSSSCSLLSSASSLASSSSILSSKSDQSFSNDFLWSCVKENPQILFKVSNSRRASLPTRKPNGLTVPSPQRVIVRPAAQKRPRSNSPSNLTRQKSFRRDAEVEPNKPISRSGRDLRPMSPSSSRRFNGEYNNQGRNMTSSMRRENSYVRPPSPSKSLNGNSKRFNGNGRSNNMLIKREKEDVIKGVSSKIEELTMGSSQNMDLMPIEDVNNPHIALDCFIFL